MKDSFINAYCDGAARGNPGPAAAAFAIFNSHGKVLVKKGKTVGLATNNVAEYKAVIFALEWIQNNSQGFKINMFLDSQLVVSQLTGKFRIRDKKLIALASQVKELEQKIHGKIFYHNIPRAKNKIADILANQALDGK